MASHPPHFVAIKRINATSAPARILDELSYLRVLGGRANIIPIITGSRFEDQVLVVFPYFCMSEFREQLEGPFKPHEVACYMRLLFMSLQWIHKQGIMHRDIKPSNFLFSARDPNCCRAVLVDFGLAQREIRNSHATSHGKPVKRSKGGMEMLREGIGKLPPGYFNNDPRYTKRQSLYIYLSIPFLSSFPCLDRPPMKASRAGTRGFRAPEVLFKCQAQGVAIDIWSAGVILLTLMTQRYYPSLCNLGALFVR